MNVEPINVQQGPRHCSLFSVPEFVTFHNKRVKSWGICIYTKLKNAELGGEKTWFVLFWMLIATHSQKKRKNFCSTTQESEKKWCKITSSPISLQAPTTLLVQLFPKVAGFICTNEGSDAAGLAGFEQRRFPARWSSSGGSWIKAQSSVSVKIRTLTASETAIYHQGSAALQQTAFELRRGKKTTWNESRWKFVKSS